MESNPKPMCLIGTEEHSRIAGEKFKPATQDLLDAMKKD